MSANKEMMLNVLKHRGQVQPLRITPDDWNFATELAARAGFDSLDAAFTQMRREEFQARALRWMRSLPECDSCQLCVNTKLGPFEQRFIVCAKCGNKRCPKANNHRHTCARSNESGQVGSAYE